ncbi:efflux RND transporter periplasmic adaptor subunit [Thalassotalea sp. HSM 43]|uniref:efflux RND transporter periplasmic adaptor subunit n=1 Tax=Thalassotalea sp. HSM 43 TaxID=2552945 RepID=UPI001081BCDE|nr:efflux RND transporter periplasmic adaptor subunit [Thalassotalea sp. HSM 43]QBY03530.1 efflux RND transporter periplasmic adaptor subunit [Thalassotalea sp. HSM 43]
MSTGKISTLVVGVVLGAAAVFGYQQFAINDGAVEQSSEKKPLYWVAPMDANYRRDKPGKSPMGMDLVPVYEEDDPSDEYGPGAISIAPNVVNNLGVKTQIVERRSLTESIEALGQVVYNEDSLIHLHPRVEGWVDNLYVRAVGNPVKKGQPLYTMYSLELVNAQQEYLVALNSKQALLIEAARQRLLSLKINDEFIDILHKSRKVSQSVTFYAPQSGIIDGLNVREGFYVEPGTTLMSIGQLDEVWVEAEVFASQSHLLAPGQSVVMSVDYLPGKQFSGVVNYIYPTLDASSRAYRLRIRFANPERLLKPNMYAKVHIDVGTSESLLTVPTDAVIRTGKQDKVVVAFGGGKFKSVEVKLGRNINGYTEILSGLLEGDFVVTSAQFLLDSESSNSSDFQRIQAKQLPAATVDGVINAIDSDNRVVNISRGPIEKWDRPAATMDFILASHIDIEQLKVGMKVTFTFEIDDDFVVIKIAPQESHSSHAGHDMGGES